MISVVIPSKSRPGQSRFLMRAIQSVKACGDCEIIVAVDHREVHEFSGVRFVEGGPGQALAMNAGMEAATGEYLAFLEDDDAWMPSRLKEGLEALEQADFTSCTQLEVDEDGGVIRINDFPTPSGWLMRRAVWEQVGPMDPEYRFHLDNEWLGRLSRTDFRRLHLVEATAPITHEDAQNYRPWLASLIKNGGMHSALRRTKSFQPLVERGVHREQNMAKISRDSDYAAQSAEETQRLVKQYGYMPR